MKENKVIFDEVMLWPATTEPLLAPGEDVDLLTVSPQISHCDLLEDYLTADSITVAKLMYVPINPVWPPPIRNKPRPLTLRLLEDERLGPLIIDGANPRLQQEASGQLTEAQKKLLKTRTERVRERMMVLAQCSLQSTLDVLEPLGYRLLQLDKVFAVFGHVTVFGGNGDEI